MLHTCYNLACTDLHMEFHTFQQCSFNFLSGRNFASGCSLKFSKLHPAHDSNVYIKSHSCGLLVVSKSKDIDFQQEALLIFQNVKRKVNEFLYNLSRKL